MSKYLEKLCSIYKEAAESKYAKSSMFSMLCKTRNKAYSMAFSEDLPTDKLQESILSESDAFSSLLTNIALNPALPKSDFDNVMTIVSNMNKTTFGHLDEDLQMQVVESEIGKVREVLKTLKQNPHKAGIKIKSARFALKSLNDEKENLLGKWGEERETSDIIENLENSEEQTL